VIPEKHRLPLKSQFPYLKKEGRLYQSYLFGLLLAPQLKEKLPFRTAFVISTKVDKKANKRNKARRWLKEALNLYLPSLKPGWDGVFLGKKALIGSNFGLVKKEMEAIFKKANLLQNKTYEKNIT